MREALSGAKLQNLCPCLLGQQQRHLFWGLIIVKIAEMRDEKEVFMAVDGDNGKFFCDYWYWCRQFNCKESQCPLSLSLRLDITPNFRSLKVGCTEINRRNTQALCQ